MFLIACTERLQLDWNIEGGKYRSHSFENVHKPGTISGGITVVKLNKHEKWSPKITIGCQTSNKENSVALVLAQLQKQGPLYALFLAFEDKTITANEVLFEVEMNRRNNFSFAWDASGLFIVGINDAERSAIVPIVSKMNCRLHASTIDVKFQDLQHRF